MRTSLPSIFLSSLLLIVTGCSDADNNNFDKDDDVPEVPVTYDWFADADTDGFGDPANVVNAERAPSGYIADNTDCDDTNSAVNPDGIEIVNGIDDNCDGTIDLAFQYVFTTSKDDYTGDLAQFDPDTNNGLVGADNECQRLADASALPRGIYKAWLSSSAAGSSAGERLTQSMAPYQLATGALIANDWVDLTDGGLITSISVDETGASVLAIPFAWTGTETDGTALADTCNDWTDSTNTYQGVIGIPISSTGQWTNDSSPSDCSIYERLYCIQQ